MPADAVLVFNDWHQNFVKDVGPRLPECVISFAPASHQADLAGERYIWGRQTDGDDVVSEPHPLLSLDQSQVVLVGEEVVLGVDHLPHHLVLHVLVGLCGRREVPLSHPHADL